MKKISLILFTGVFLVGSGIFVFSDKGFAASENAHTVTECKQGDLELGAFLQSILGNQSYMELLNPILDLFRNTCQVLDIMALDSELDAARKAIQQAFLMCDREEIPSIEKAYYEVDAELYYVRNLVKLKFGSAMGELLDTASMGTVDIGEKKNVELEDPEILHGKMVEKYEKVFGKYGPDEFNIVMERIKTKYESRKFKYVDCDENGWQRVKDKFVEFIDNLGGLREGAEAIEDAALSGAEAIRESAEDLKKIGSSNSGGFIKNMFDVKLNGLDPQKGFEEILEGVKGNDFWSSGGDTIDQGTLLNAMGSARVEYEAKVQKAKLEARYEALYKHNTDAHVRAFIKAVDEFKFYVIKGIATIGQVEDCVEHMLDKQCPK
ncbi:hypothetical protein HOG17_00800 [Candidatus Peregrinibacteria bacterium]|nr:hypothetical protein [Candidatus Peregrinibacteria bacterium]MBT4455774.1 hypothetical protein [Candidatus Peregrinibacteria bacterium]